MTGSTAVDFEYTASFSNWGHGHPETLTQLRSHHVAKPDSNSDSRVCSGLPALPTPRPCPRQHQQRPALPAPLCPGDHTCPAPSTQGHTCPAPGQKTGQPFLTSLRLCLTWKMGGDRTTAPQAHEAPAQGPEGPNGPAEDEAGQVHHAQAVGTVVPSLVAPAWWPRPGDPVPVALSRWPCPSGPVPVALAWGLAGLGATRGWQRRWGPTAGPLPVGSLEVSTHILSPRIVHSFSHSPRRCSGTGTAANRAKCCLVDTMVRGVTGRGMHVHVGERTASQRRQRWTRGFSVTDRQVLSVTPHQLQEVTRTSRS